MTNRVQIQIDALDREAREIGGLVALSEAQQGAVERYLEKDLGDNGALLSAGAHLQTLLARAYSDLTAEIDQLKDALKA